MSTSEPKIVAGLTFHECQLDDISKTIDDFVAARTKYYHRFSGRFIYLLQDKNTKLYEVKTSTNVSKGLRAIAAGKCSAWLKMLYPNRVQDNINVWVAESVDGISDWHVESELFGSWINKKKENDHAKRLASRIGRMSDEEILEFRRVNPKGFARVGQALHILDTPAQ